jgi:hypothetical protein
LSPATTSSAASPKIVSGPSKIAAFVVPPTMSSWPASPWIASPGRAEPAPAGLPPAFELPWIMSSPAPPEIVSSPPWPWIRSGWSSP